MDRLEAMSILVMAVETGSFSAASRKLGVPLPTVSRKVSELEAHLNTRLLTRSTRSLVLTDAGAAYVAACKGILELVGDAERAASGEYTSPKGDLVITAPVVFGRMHVLPVIVEFLAAYSAINVRLVLSDRNADLLDDQIDVALRIGTLADNNMVALRIGEVRRVVCGSPAYFAMHGVPTSPSDIVRLATIAFEGLGGYPHWQFAQSNAEPLPLSNVRPRLTVTTAEAAIDAAIIGMGVTQVLSYQVAAHIASDKLQCVLERFEPPAIPVHLLHLGQGRVARKLRVFLDFAAPRLQRRINGC